MAIGPEFLWQFAIVLWGEGEVAVIDQRRSGAASEEPDTGGN